MGSFSFDHISFIGKFIRVWNYFIPWDKTVIDQWLVSAFFFFFGLLHFYIYNYLCGIGIFLI